MRPRNAPSSCISWALFFFVSFVSVGCRTTKATDPDVFTIAVIPKGTSHVFWQSIHAGAEKAAREIGATIIWRGPLREDDRASQVSEVEGFVSRSTIRRSRRRSPKPSAAGFRSS